MRRSSAAFTANWGSSACRGGIRASSFSSSTLASGSRFISSTSCSSSATSISSSSSSLSTLLLKTARPSSSSPASSLLSRSLAAAARPGSSGGARSPLGGFASQAEQGAAHPGARSGLPRLNASPSTSLLAPLSAAATRAADLATAASGGKKESGEEESDEPSSRSRPSATASPPHPGVGAAKPPEDAAEAKPKLGKVRAFLKKYGAVGVVTYFGLYGATLASFYGAFSSGLLYAGDVVGLIEYLHLGDVLDESSLSPKVGNFALAWVSTKFTEPLRFAITLAITPSISRWWTGHHQHKLEARREREQLKQQELHDHEHHHDQQQQQQQQEGEEKERKEEEHKQDVGAGKQ